MTFGGQVPPRCFFGGVLGPVRRSGRETPRSVEKGLGLVGRSRREVSSEETTSHQERSGPIGRSHRQRTGPIVRDLGHVERSRRERPGRGSRLLA